jgi:CheY-like chemotaxis protein
VALEGARDLRRRVPGVGERGDQIPVRGFGAERRVDPDGELGARVEAVLQPGQLVEQLALRGCGGRVRDALEAYEDASEPFPEPCHGGRVSLGFPCPHSPLHAHADDTRLHSRPMVAQDRPAVVVADDNDAMRMVCRINLELSGYRVVEAGSGEELERVLAGAETVALVLLDINLGDRDGMDIARELKKDRPEIPIAFLTGSGFSREEAAVVGDATISKPFTLEELTETVSRLART